MRVPTVLAVVLLVSAAPHAMATSSTIVLDPEGDDSVSGLSPLFQSVEQDLLVSGLPADEWGDCHARAADITVFAIESDAETVTLSLRLASLDDLRATCSIMTGDLGARAAYDAVMFRAAEEELPGDAFVGIAGVARSTGIGIVGCIEVFFVDERAEECVGSFERDGDVLRWSAPLEGTVTVETSELTDTEPRLETRAFDLRGLALRAGASADVALDKPFGLVRISDHAEEADVVL